MQKARVSNNAANLGFESELWRAAALRSNMDAAEYKHVVLGLIFLKYISDAFEEQRARLEAERALGAEPEDSDYVVPRIGGVSLHCLFHALIALDLPSFLEPTSL